MECIYCNRQVSEDIEPEEDEIATEDWVDEYSACVDCVAEGKPFE